jgi:hypothetical protein
MDQREALAHELGIRDDVVTLPQRGIFEYFRRFSNELTNQDAIWPIIFLWPEEG